MPVGACLNFDREAVLLHTTSLGHCGETAADVARVLRSNGWRVKVRETDYLKPTVVSLGGFASLGAFADQTGPVLSDEPERPEPTEDVVPTKALRPDGLPERGFKMVCLVCGHTTSRQARHVESHRRNRGHDQFVEVPSADVPAVQARVRLTQTQASAPDGPEAPQEAPGQRANGYTHPGSPEAPE